jgi:sugar O-acyltransferase (sialic acid O-acetyltransferase NeuD family)
VRYLVIGAGGHAEEVAWSLREQAAAEGESCELLFFDDRKPRGPLPSGLGSVVGTLSDVTQVIGELSVAGVAGDRNGNHAPGAGRASASDPTRSNGVQLVLGLGLPRVKSVVVSRLTSLELPWRTVVHPRATVGPNVAIGEGSYVAPGAILTVNARVGSFVTVNMHCQVAHDGVVEDFATLHPDVHLAGKVAIGKGAELGTGAIVIPGLSIGPWAVLGAGSTAVKSLVGGRTYVGVPARELRRERMAVVA